MFSQEDKKIEALDIYEQLFLSEHMHLSPSNFKYCIKEMIYECENDTKLLTRAMEIYKTGRQHLVNKENRKGNSFDKDEINDLDLGEYRLVKALYGRDHPFIHSFIQKSIEGVLKDNDYIGYTLRKRLYKFFQIEGKSKQGYEVFLKLFEKNNQYSTLGNKIYRNNL